MAQLYGIKKDDLLAEVHQMQRLLERNKEQGETVSSTLEWIIINSTLERLLWGHL